MFIRVHPWFLPPNPLRSFSLLFLKFVDSLLSLFFQSQNETIVCLSGFNKTQTLNHVSIMKTRQLFAALALLMSSVASAQQTSPDQIKFFEENIRPALVKYCYECHSAEAGDSQGGLLLDTRMGLMQGGDAGAAIEPGNADDSLLWEAINWEGYEMPPSQKMPASVIANFKKWIDMGAPDPRVREITNFNTKITAEDIDHARSEHWSFTPPLSESDATIDSLVAERLHSEGLV